jgi:phosphotransacetylase
MSDVADLDPAMRRLGCLRPVADRLRRLDAPVRLLLWEPDDARCWQLAGSLRAAPNVRVSMLARTHSSTVDVDLLDPDQVLAAWKPARGSTDAPTSPCQIAAAALALGLVDAVVGGMATSSADVLRAGFRFVGLSSDVRTVSIGGFVEPVAGPLAGRLLLMTDTGAVLEPTADQFVDIAVNAVKSWRAVTSEPPRIAYLSASTHGSAPGLRGLDAIRSAVGRVRAMDVDVDGEIQIDAAVVPEIARAKGLSGNAAGRANILIFPNLDACNIGYKLAEHLGGARTAPVTQGFARSFHDVSRGASVEDLFATCLIAALLALPAASTSLRDA